jgi:transcriptional regulator with XRE-family HTH domain
MFVTAEKTPLAEFIERLLSERKASIRALAMYMDVSDRTVRRMIEGENPEPETLKKLAEYANFPVGELFKMVGWLDEPSGDLDSEMLAEIEHLLRTLPEASQRKIRDMIRLEHEYLKQQDEGSKEQARKAS